MNTSRARSLALSILTVALGGAAAAVVAYLTDHQADDPALYGAAILGVRELSKWIDSRDWTRSKVRVKAAKAKP